MNKLILATLLGVVLGFGAGVPASAQEAAAPGACIVREQAEQLISTLKQRNDQLRDLSERLRAMEAQVAAAEADRKMLDASRKALALAAEKNRDLRELGDQIIADYEKMDLGKKTAAGEPLTQLYRVRLQNKLQEFGDQIAALGFYPERDVQPVEAAPAASNP